MAGRLGMFGEGNMGRSQHLGMERAWWRVGEKCGGLEASERCGDQDDARGRLRGGRRGCGRRRSPAGRRCVRDPGGGRSHRPLRRRGAVRGGGEGPAARPDVTGRGGYRLRAALPEAAAAPLCALTPRCRSPRARGARALPRCLRRRR